MMAREVDHRANNLLAVMQGLLHLTKADTVEAYKNALQGRISALARANSLIAEHRWTDVNLTSLVKEEVAAFEEGDRVRIKGDPLSITPAAAQSLGMMIHELCTNSIKIWRSFGRKGRDCHLLVDGRFGKPDARLGGARRTVGDGTGARGHRQHGDCSRGPSAWRRDIPGVEAYSGSGVDSVFAASFFAARRA